MEKEYYVEGSAFSVQYHGYRTFAHRIKAEDKNDAIRQIKKKYSDCVIANIEQIIQ